MSHKIIKSNNLNSLVDAYISVYEENGVLAQKTKINIPVDLRNRNILYVINDNYDMQMMYEMINIIDNISSDYNIYLLMADKSTINIYKYNPRRGNVFNLLDDDLRRVFEFIEKWYMKHDFTLLTESKSEYKNVYKRIIRNYTIDLIHIQHMAYHTIDLLEVAKDKQINTILTLNDLYYIKPTNTITNDKYMQYDENNPMVDKKEDDMIDNTYPNLELFNQIWTKRCSKMFKYPKYIIAQSNSIHDIYTQTYPEIKDKIKIIKQGYDINVDDEITSPTLNHEKPARILIPGDINTIDDIKYLEDLKKQDIENNLEFHILGENKTEYNVKSLAKLHSEYSHESFKKQIENIKPQFIGEFLEISNLHSYNLTQAWNNKIPVLAINNTTSADYIKESGGGYVLSEDPKKACEKIVELLSDDEKYQIISDQIANIDIEDTESMLSEYINLYDNIIRK